MATSDYTISTLPANVEAERSILGAILLDNFAYNQAAEHLRIEDFSLDSHRRIYTRMVDLAESSRPIARNMPVSTASNVECRSSSASITRASRRTPSRIMSGSG